MFVTIKKDLAARLVSALPNEGESVKKEMKKGHVFVGAKKRGAVKQFTLFGEKRHVESVLARHA